jgi:Uma2 family endonuclease
MATTRIATVDDLLAIEDDGYQYELVNGEIRRMSPAGGEASKLALGLGARIWNHVVGRQLGDVFGADCTFVLFEEPLTAVAPDVAFVRAHRLPSRSELPRPLHLAPDLAVEVVSPSDTMPQVAKKVRCYLDAGTPLVWVVIPRRKQVMVHRTVGDPITLGVDDELDGGDVLPGFQLKVADIFF